MPLAHKIKPAVTPPLRDLDAPQTCRAEKAYPHFGIQRPFPKRYGLLQASEDVYNTW